jgi:predicted RNase H-like nuclease (RuvC/YqgF family)
MLQLESNRLRYWVEKAKHEAVTAQLQKRIQEGAEAARSAGEATAEQLAMKDAALDDRDEQIAALTAKLAQSEQARTELETALQQTQQPCFTSRKRHRPGSNNVQCCL